MMLYFDFGRKPNAIAYWCFSCCWVVLHGAKDVSTSYVLPAGGLQGHRKLREGRIRTAHLNWPKGHSILYNIMQKALKIVELVRGCCFWETGWTSVGAWWAFVSCINHFVNIYYIIIITVIIFFLPSFSVLVKSFYLNAQVLLCSFIPSSFTSPIGRGTVSKQQSGADLLPG